MSPAVHSVRGDDGRLSVSCLVGIDVLQWVRAREGLEVPLPGTFLAGPWVLTCCGWHCPPTSEVRAEPGPRGGPPGRSLSVLTSLPMAVGGPGAALVTNQAQGEGGVTTVLRWRAGAGARGVPLRTVNTWPTRALCVDCEEPRLHSILCLVGHRDQVSWVGP